MEHETNICLTYVRRWAASEYFSTLINDHHIHSAAIKLRITFRRNLTCKKIFLFEARHSDLLKVSLRNVLKAFVLFPSLNKRGLLLNHKIKEVFPVL